MKNSPQTSDGVLQGVPTVDGVAKPAQAPANPDFKVPVNAAELKANASTLELGSGNNSSVLYDGKLLKVDQNAQQYSLSGDVVFIGAGYVITADDVKVNYPAKEMTATGHVLVIHQNQVFTGERIFMKWETGDFTIEKAVLVASDPNKIREVSEKILGLTTQELEYETAKKTRLEDIAKDREKLREDFRKSPAQTPDQELLERYTRLLEEDTMTANSVAPSLAQRDQMRRRRFEERRVFWELGRAQALKSKVPATVYFRLQGESLERKDGNTYTAQDAIFTPCICADDETPAWGFQADKIVAEQEGYINLKHPVLTIKGVPIIYLPYLKLPLKAQRQSGFLIPSFQSSSRNGFVYTQPVFFDFGPNADTTLTSDIFQKRGTRVGAEARYEASQHSGIRYEIDTIRDHQWLDQANYRRDLLEFYQAHPVCTNPDPVANASCMQLEDTTHLSPPNNTWRGKQDWDGRYNIAPRLSFVTKGKVVSDHRYLDDLYIPQEIVTAFAPKANANAFSNAKAKLDFDGEDFYAGLRTAYGDNSIVDKQYAGQQIPASLNFQSRYFRLFPASWWTTPSYGEIRAGSVQIQDRGLPETSMIKPPATLAPGQTSNQLGSGNWNRIGFNVITPISTDGIFKIDHFADAEVRYIEARGFDDKNSTIRTWKTGINLNLPIDGLGRLPDFMQPKEGTRYGQHIMNWGLSFSIRPSVARDGPYGDLKNANGAPLVYFQSDRERLFIDDQDVLDEDTMVKHKRVTLSTQHRWRIFDRVDQALPATTDKVDEYDSEMANLQEQARRELMSVKDRAVRSADEMYRTDPNGSTDWLIRRYKTTDQDAIEPVNFAASITYDGYQETLRKEQLRANDQLEEQAIAAGPAAAPGIRAQKVTYTQLPESWIGPSASLGLNYKGLTLDSSVLYNIYERTSTSVGFGLGLPTFYSTQVGLRYSLAKQAQPDPVTEDLNYLRTKTTTFGLASGAIKYVTLGVNLIREQVEQRKVRYATSYQIAYDDKSGCWGIQFLREKDLSQLEEQANYILQVAVIFLGNRRGADVSPGIERVVRGEKAIEREKQ